MPRRSLARLYKDEFSGYSLAKFQQDATGRVNSCRSCASARAGVWCCIGSHSIRRAGDRHHRRACYWGAGGRALPDIRSNRRNERSIDRACSKIWVDRNLGRRSDGWHFSHDHRPAAAWTIYRLYPITGDHRFYLRHCADHIHRANR